MSVNSEEFKRWACGRLLTSSQPITRCAFCGSYSFAGYEPPEDDEFWEAEADHHEPNCEWLLTRGEEC